MPKAISWLVHSLLINEEGDVEYSKVVPPQLYKKEKGYGWIHLSAKCSKTRSWLLKHSGTEKIWINALTAPETRPRFAKISSDSFFINLRAINSIKTDEPEDMISIRLFITKNQIISSKIYNLKAVDIIENDFKENNPPKSTARFLLRLIEYVNIEIENIIASIHEKINDLEEMTLIKHNRDFRHNVINVRRQMIIFRRYLIPDLEAIRQLSLMSEFFPLGSELHDHLLEDIHKMTRYIEEINSIIERAQVIHEELNNHLTERLNSSTNKLSLVATIFMPMSLVTGLFGVNLAGIPYASNEKAFPLFAIIVVGILIFQVIIFKLLKWF